jgi:hypothetical protein
MPKGSVLVTASTTLGIAGSGSIMSTSAMPWAWKMALIAAGALSRLRKSDARITTAMHDAKFYISYIPGV